MTADRASSVVVRPARRRRNRAALLSGVLVALVVLAGGALFWQLWPAEQRATSTLVVLPDANSAEAASYYDMPHIPWDRLRVLQEWDGS